MPVRRGFQPRTLHLPSLKCSLKKGFTILQRRFSTVDVPWREAASLILVSPNKNPSSLSYLMMQRSSGSTLQPGGTVFPGGALSPVDSSSRWLSLYSKAGVDLNSVSFMSQNAHIPNIYNAVPPSGKESFPRSVVFRLTAIRETFEEMGLLLCKPLDKLTSTRSLGNDPNEIQNLELFQPLQNKDDILQWQNRIMENPLEFLTLCEELQVLPDLDALYEWTNWLTPTIVPKKSRFDVVFYIAILPKQINPCINTHEVSKAAWSTPSSLLADHKKGSIQLMPPQLYDLNRLQNLTKVEDLETRIRYRKEHGIERHFPVMTVLKDAQLFLLPGDALYPASPDFYTIGKPARQDLTLEEINSKNKGSNRHRSEIVNGGNEAKVNVVRYGHLY